MKRQDKFIESALETINQIQLAIKSIGVYPEDHPSTAAILRKSYTALINVLNGKNTFTIGADGDKLLFDDHLVESSNPLLTNFAAELNHRDIGSLSFYRGLSWNDYLLFIKAMVQKSKPRGKPIDIASILKNNNISTIRLNTIRYERVSGDGEKGEANHAAGIETAEMGYHTPVIHDLTFDSAPPISPGDTAEMGYHTPVIHDLTFDSAPPISPGDTAEMGYHTPVIHDLTFDSAPPISPGDTAEIEHEISQNDASSVHQSDNSNEPSTAPECNGGHQPETGSPFNGETITNYVYNLLLSKKSDNLDTIIEELSCKMDDKSDIIREKISECLQNITAGNEIDSLKDNYQKISNSLLNWVTKTNHADTYLDVTKCLQNIHTLPSLRKLDSYLCDETVGGRLLACNELSKDGLQKALEERQKNGKSLQYNLAALNLVPEEVLTGHLAQQFKNCRTVTLSKLDSIPESTLLTIPEKYARRYQILPFRIEAGNLYAATMNPNDWQLLKDIRFITNYPTIPHLAAEYFLLQALDKFYNIKTLGSASNHTLQLEDWNTDLEIVEETQQPLQYMEELKDSDAPIIQLANVILDEAIKQRASDIHIEPYEYDLRVRFRVDGTLLTVLNPAKSYTNGLVSRIKIMSGMDISERRLPQDGRFKTRTNGRVIDFRVSTFPGIYGEKIVLRLLDNSDLVLQMDNLGLNETDLTVVSAAMYKSKGMILVTGPTGSGKTTTIYTMLRDLNDGTLNISTAEDPVEYNLKGINQFQMNTKIGLNFARALRTFLRQDPDVIMVGEIRDFETAEIAFKAALTGHLVLSTLHTNNAPETITRLLNIGIEPYMINSSVIMIISQRLIRKNCQKCKVEITPTDIQANIFKSYGFTIAGSRYFRGEGCEDCSHTGYRGRLAIYEVLPLWDDVQGAIAQGKPASEIRVRAEKHGFTSLQIQGFTKVTEGVTSLNEWLRVLA